MFTNNEKYTLCLLWYTVYSKEPSTSTCQSHSKSSLCWWQGWHASSSSLVLCVPQLVVVAVGIGWGCASGWCWGHIGCGNLCCHNGYCCCKCACSCACKWCTHCFVPCHHPHPVAVGGSMVVVDQGAVVQCVVADKEGICDKCKGGRRGKRGQCVRVRNGVITLSRQFPMFDLITCLCLMLNIDCVLMISSCRCSVIHKTLNTAPLTMTTAPGPNLDPINSAMDSKGGNINKHHAADQIPNCIVQSHVHIHNHWPQHQAPNWTTRHPQAWASTNAMSRQGEMGSLWGKHAPYELGCFWGQVWGIFRLASMFVLIYILLAFPPLCPPITSTHKTQLNCNQTCENPYPWWGYRLLSRYPGVTQANHYRGLILQFETKETAEWFKQPKILSSILPQIDSSAMLKNRTYQILVPRVPVTFETDSKESLCELEEQDGIKDGILCKARWIKLTYRRVLGQWYAHLALSSVNSPGEANIIIRDGIHICGIKAYPKKLKTELKQCMKCHKWGHFTVECL